MLDDLKALFTGADPLDEIGELFAQMVERATHITRLAGKVAFEGDTSTQKIVFDEDIQINKLERDIRRRLLTHCTVQGSAADIGQSLRLMSLVKDVERLGDYAKNLTEIAELNAPWPEDENFSNLGDIRTKTELLVGNLSSIVREADAAAAAREIRAGRDLAHRCDVLVPRIAESGYASASTTAMILASRYYKRIGAHATNILSGIVMPLHKLDYYDEDAMRTTEAT